MISTLASNIFFTSLGMAAYYYFAWRHTETAAAANLVELDNTEKSVGHGSRILEPLISITIDNNKEDINTYTKTLILHAITFHQNFLSTVPSSSEIAISSPD